MGHNDLGTTLIYAAVSGLSLEEAIHKLDKPATAQTSNKQTTVVNQIEYQDTQHKKDIRNAVPPLQNLIHLPQLHDSFLLILKLVTIKLDQQVTQSKHLQMENSPSFFLSASIFNHTSKPEVIPVYLPSLTDGKSNWLEACRIF